MMELLRVFNRECVIPHLLFTELPFGFYAEPERVPSGQIWLLCNKPFS